MANRKLLYPSLSKSLSLPPIPPSSLVFSTFSQPAPIAKVATPQQPSPLFEVTRVILAVTPATLVFTKFSEPSRLRTNQQIDDSSSFFTALTYTPSASPKWIDYIPSRKPPQEGFIANTVLPTTPVIIVAGGFQDWDPPSRTKYIQDISKGFFVTSTAAAITPAAFTGFLAYAQPNPTKSIKLDDQINVLEIAPTPPVFSDSVAFSGFPFAFRNKLLYQAGSFIPLPPVVIQPYIFSAFEQPQFRPTKAVIPDVNNVTLPQAPTTTTVFIFNSFDQIQLSSRIFHQADSFVLPQQQAAPTPSDSIAFSGFPYAFRSKLFYQAGSFVVPASVLVVAQPYVFSSFEQPQFKKPIEDIPVQFELLSIANPIPPVFTGFNDFGTAQQLIGTQRRQDGSSVDFRVLQPVFVPSVVQFGGWYDFGLRPNPISFKAYEQPQVVYEILVPPIPLESAFAGKRWKYQETKKTPEIKNKVLPLKSSNLAAMSYDEDKKELRLTFKTYKYENVSKKKVQNLSHGEYFQKHIKAKHPTTKV